MREVYEARSAQWPAHAGRIGRETEGTPDAGLPQEIRSLGQFVTNEPSDPLDVHSPGEPVGGPRDRPNLRISRRHEVPLVDDLVRDRGGDFQAE